MATRRNLTERIVTAWYVLIWLVLLAAIIYAFGRGNSLTSPSLVIALGIFIVFSILAVRASTRLFACLSLTTLVVPFYLFEAYLWVTTALRAPDLSSSKAEYVAKLREQGIAAYPALFPSGFLQLWQGASAKTQSPIVIGGGEILPLAGIPDVLTVYCPKPDAGWVTYRSDAFGFRTPTIEERGAAPEFALLGDSFVQGYCVSDIFTYAHQLSALGPTLSYGMNGTSALAQLAIFREYVRPIRPHHIIWFFYEGSDIPEYLAERTWPLLRAYFERGYMQDLVNLNGLITSAMRRFVDQHFEGIEVATVGHDWQRFAQNDRILSEMVDLLLFRRAKTVLSKIWEPTGPTTEMAETEWREVTDIWHEVIEIQRAQDHQITFVYIPAHWRFLSNDPAPFQALEQKVVRLWSELSVDYVSLTPVLGAMENPLAYYVENDRHFNEEGYRLTAEAIVDHLRRAAGG